MTSKNLFFNLMKENTKQRLWTVALISLIFFFTFPVQTALLISSYLSQDRIDAVWEREAQGVEVIKQQLQERYLSWTAIDNGMLVFLLIVFAVVCGISGFAYLHSRKKTDFYHAIPVKRERLFTAVYLNGVLYTAVPYLISLLISSSRADIPVGRGVKDLLYPYVVLFVNVYGSDSGCSDDRQYHCQCAWNRSVFPVGTGNGHAAYRLFQQLLYYLLPGREQIRRAFAKIITGSLVYRSGIRTGKSRLNGAVGGCSNRTSYRALCISV